MLTLTLSAVAESLDVRRLMTSFGVVVPGVMSSCAIADAGMSSAMRPKMSPWRNDNVVRRPGRIRQRVMAKLLLNYLALSWRRSRYKRVILPAEGTRIRDTTTEEATS